MRPAGSGFSSAPQPMKLLHVKMPVPESAFPSSTHCGQGPFGDFGSAAPAFRAIASPMRRFGHVLTTSRRRASEEAERSAGSARR